MNNPVSWNKVGWLMSALVACSSLLGCSSEEDNIIMAPLPEIKSQFEPQELWQHQVGDGVGRFFSKLVPQVAYNKIFAASRNGIVEALDPKSADVLWQVDLSDIWPNIRISAGLTLSYGKVFLGTEDGQVIALSAQNGKKLWSKMVNGEVLAQPTTDSNVVVIHTNQGQLLGLDQGTGRIKWNISNEVPNLSLRGDSRPITFSGGVFWGMANGRVGAALVGTGQLLWIRTVGLPQGGTDIDRLIDVDSKPYITQGKMFVVSYNGQLVSIDLKSGEIVWKRPYSSATDITSDGKSLFLVTDNDHLVAIDMRNGNKIWENKRLENRRLTAPVSLYHYLVVGDSQGYLHWVERQSGRLIAQQEINHAGFAVAPVATDDGYLLSTRDGELIKASLSVR